jgi:DNA-binding NarL/FixJ family response regulator
VTLTVLLVDDQDMYRSAVRAHLERVENIRVVDEASDGTTAVKLAATLCPDVVVLDLYLPDLDGVEVTRQIKRARPETGVVVLSGYVDEAERTATRRAGALDLFDKSLAFDELVPAIEAASGRARR